MNEVLLPKISILIAARNEEDCIIDCLDSIQQLTYPKDKLEVLIGNDQSTDFTLELIQNYIADKAIFQIFDIKQELDNQQGKANVLAQLASKAQGDIYFFTDADTVLRAHSLQPVEDFINNPALGVIGGFTLVKPKGFFAVMQSLEWLEALSLIKIATDLKIPVTAMGNNMFVSAEAYHNIGGFENLSFSLIEDFTLFHTIVQEGYHFKQVFSKDLIAYTRACDTVEELLQQRKRWMRGAMQLSWWIQLPLWLVALLMPILLLSFMIFPKIAFWILIFFISGHVFYMFLNVYQIQLQYLFPYLIPYTLYKILTGFVYLLYYFLPFSIKWKGRTYR